MATQEMAQSPGRVFSSCTDGQRLNSQSGPATFLVRRCRGRHALNGTTSSVPPHRGPNIRSQGQRPWSSSASHASPAGAAQFQPTSKFDCREVMYSHVHISRRRIMSVRFCPRPAQSLPARPLAVHRRSVSRWRRSASACPSPMTSRQDPSIAQCHNIPPFELLRRP